VRLVPNKYTAWTNIQLMAVIDGGTVSTGNTTIFETRNPCSLHFRGRAKALTALILGHALRNLQSTAWCQWAMRISMHFRLHPSEVFFFLLSLWLYNSLYWVLAFSTNSFHLLLPWTRVYQFGTYDFCISFLTSSTQRVFGLPVGRHKYSAYVISCVTP
jgi:hypothetical protein